MSISTIFSARKGFAAILIILAVVALIGLLGGAYYLGKSNLLKPQNQNTTALTSPQSASTPTQDQNSSLKTYTSTKYGFAVDYPASWTVKESTQTDVATLTPPGAENPVIKIDVSNMVLDDRGPIPFEEYVKTAAKNEIQGYNSLVSISEVTTKSGIKGFKTTWKVSPPPGAAGGSSVSNPMTYFPLSERYGSGMQQKRLELSLESDDGTYTDNYDTILGTLRYTQ